MGQRYPAERAATLNAVGERPTLYEENAFALSCAAFDTRSRKDSMNDCHWQNYEKLLILFAIMHLRAKNSPFSGSGQTIARRCCLHVFRLGTSRLPSSPARSRLHWPRAIAVLGQTGRGRRRSSRPFRRVTDACARAISARGACNLLPRPWRGGRCWRFHAACACTVVYASQAQPPLLKRSITARLAQNMAPDMHH